MASEQKTKWTPGPWSEGRDVNGELWVDDPKGSPICRVAPEPNTEDIADARLIAAAPEMYEALEDAENRLIAIGSLLNGNPSSDDIREAYNLAYSGKQRAALAQATGEGRE